MDRRPATSVLWLCPIVIVLAALALSRVDWGGSENWGNPLAIALAPSSIAVQGAAMTASASVPHDASIAGTPPPCSVTVPNGNTPPGEPPNVFQHGNGELWTELWPEGRVLIEPQDARPDGALAMKWPWWRGVRGQLSIEGARLDEPAAPMQADIPEGYGETGFQATALIFPTEGCWEITGKAGGASLTFVTLVVKVDARM